MARDTKPTADVAQAQATPGTPLALDGTKLGESQVATETKPADEVPVIGAPPVVDTSVLAENDPKGDLRPGVIPDTFAQGIDPASNRKVEEMDGRMPIAAPAVAPAAVASVAALTSGKKKAGGVLVRLKADYWPMPENYPEGWERDPNSPNHREYRLPVGTELNLPADEAMDLLERGQAERVKP
jgi:hypothetical protein